jgi:hypothetical protein
MGPPFGGWRSALLILFLAGCQGESPPGEIFLVAAGALGPGAHHDQPRVVNPVLLSDGHPRLSEAVLRTFRDAGYEIMEDQGQEDPGKATLYFTAPQVREAGEYRIRIYVSLGVRPGHMDRGDSWWQVDLQCGETCVVEDIAATDAPGWSRRRPGPGEV